MRRTRWLMHVGDLLITGSDEAMDDLLNKLEEKHKVSIGIGSKAAFLKRLIEVNNGETRMHLAE